MPSSSTQQSPAIRSTVDDGVARVVAEAVEFRYRRSPRSQLVDVWIEARAGRSVAITGPSGSGKSTLLALLGGLLRPTSGCLSAFWRCGGVAAPTALTSWILQATNALPRRSAIDNVAIAGLASGVTGAEAESRAGGYLRSVGLAGVGRHEARTLSGGELQRLALARALASERPFILADEPTGQLDSTTSGMIAEVMFEQATSRRLGLVIVTHDLGLAERCDDVFRLENGGLWR